MTHPEGYTALDLVGFTDRGTYASNVSYVKNDIAHYAGSLYRCKIDDTFNVTPGENANWTVFIGEPKSLVERIIAPLEDNPATVAYATGRQIIYDDYLWEVIDDIAVGDPLVDYDVDPINANIKKSLPVETQLLEVKAREGNLATLLTTAKNTLVAAINEIVGKIGDLTGLTTTAKTSAVAAINEVDANADAAQASANNAQQMLAPIETTLTASQSYTTGKQFIYNGLLYEATAAIAQGGTITISGNCKLADCVTKQLATLSDNLNDYKFVPFSENFTAIAPEVGSNVMKTLNAALSGYTLEGYIHKTMAGSGNGNLIPYFTISSDQLTAVIWRHTSTYGECSGLRGILVYKKQ